MKWLAPVVALLLGFFAGVFWVGRDAPADLGPGSSGQTLRPADVAAGLVDAAADGGSADAAAVPDMRFADTASIVEWIDSLEDVGGYHQLGALYGPLLNMPVSRFPELLEALNAPGRSSLARQMRMMIASRWAELDPAGLRMYVERLPVNERRHFTRALYWGWSRKDLPGALAAASQLSGEERMGALTVIVDSLSKGSPEAAYQVLREYMPSSSRHEWVYRNTFSAWARQDPAAALAAAEALEPGTARDAALGGVILQMATDNPMSALQWLDAQPESPQLLQSRQQILNQLMVKDLGSVQRYVESNDDAIAVKKILSGLNFRQLGEAGNFDQVESVMQWLEGVATGQVYAQKTSELVHAMAVADPARARNFVEALPPGNARMQSINSLAAALGNQDIDLALSFYQSLPYEDEREQAISSLAWQFVQNDPERAKALVLESDDPILQASLSNYLLNDFMEKDIAATLEWVGQISSERARQDSLNQVFSRWVTVDPDAAFDHIASLGEGEATTTFYRNAMNNYLRENPVDGVVWLERLAAENRLGDRASGVYQQAAREYVRHDPMAASQWIATLEPGSNRDAAVNAMVREISSYDAEAGFAWAQTMEDGNRRRRSLDQTVREWVKTDAEAARRAVEAANLEASEKERLFKLIP